MQKISQKWRFIFIVLTIIILITVYFFAVVLDIIETMSVEEVRSRVIDIVNYSNEMLLSMHFFYENYFNIVKNSNGDIVSIVANTGLINQINMIMQTEIQIRLNELRSFYLSMPFGVFTGSVFLAKFGYNVKIKVQAVSNCYTDLQSEFISVGFNQTIHRLKITAVIEIKMIAPTKTIAKNILNDIVLAENIIVGKVPDTYMGDSFDPNYLDLLP